MTDLDDDAFVSRSLGELRPVEPTARLLRQVAQIPILHPKPAATHAPRGLWSWAFGLCAAALLGVSAGWLTLSEELNSEASASALAPSEPNVGLPGVADDAETELQGMLALAWGGDESWDDDAL